MPLKGCLCWENHTCLSSDDVRNDHRCIQFLWGDDPGTEDRINVYVYNFWIKHLNDEQVREMWFKKSEINRSLWCSFMSCTVTQFFLYCTPLKLTCVWISSFIDPLFSFFFFTARSSTRGLIVIPWRQKPEWEHVDFALIVFFSVDQTVDTLRGD